MLLGHGNNTFDVSNRILTDFSSNIWYRPLHSGLINHLKNKLNNIVNYPQVDALGIQQKIALHNGLCINQVCVSSGATEAFYLIAQAFKKLKSLVIVPSFSEYEDAATMHGHQLTFLSNKEELANRNFQCDLVWLGNPNNPDGKVLSKELIENMLQNNAATIFVVDEAYGELCYGFDSVVELINKYNNLIVVKSVTKLCSIPGLRLGYFMASKTLVNKIAKYRMPWSVSTLAIEAGMYIFSNYNSFKLDLNVVKKECTELQDMLAKHEKIEVFASNTNYFLARLKEAKALELKQYLIEEHGFLIRDCSNFRELNQSHFRMAIQGKANNIACANAILNYIQ